MASAALAAGPPVQLSMAFAQPLAAVPILPVGEDWELRVAALVLHCCNLGPTWMCAADAAMLLRVPIQERELLVLAEAPRTEIPGEVHGVDTRDTTATTLKKPSLGIGEMQERMSAVFAPVLRAVVVPARMRPADALALLLAVIHDGIILPVTNGTRALLRDVQRIARS